MGAEQITHRTDVSDSGASGIVSVSEVDFKGGNARQGTAEPVSRARLSPNMTTTNFEGEGGYPPQLKSGNTPVSTPVERVALK